MTGPENDPDKVTIEPVAGENADKKPIDSETISTDSSGTGDKPDVQKSEIAETETTCLSAQEECSLPEESAAKQENETLDSEVDWEQCEAEFDEDTEIHLSQPDLTVSAKHRAISLTLTQHHVSHLLSDVLSEEQEPRPVVKGLRFPMLLDCLLGLGLLLAVGGFTVGLFHMYLIHSASQCISEQRYKAAISLLKGAPLPQIYGRTGSDTEELLSKARYLDAIDMLEAGTNVNVAIKELSEIRPGSRYFALAQEAINENTEPAPVMLQGGAETTEIGPVPVPKETLLEKTLKEDEHK